MAETDLDGVIRAIGKTQHKALMGEAKKRYARLMGLAAKAKTREGKASLKQTAKDMLLLAGAAARRLQLTADNAARQLQAGNEERAGGHKGDRSEGGGERQKRGKPRKRRPDPRGGGVRPAVALFGLPTSIKPIKALRHGPSTAPQSHHHLRDHGQYHPPRPVALFADYAAADRRQRVGGQPKWGLRSLTSTCAIPKPAVPRCRSISIATS